MKGNSSMSSFDKYWGEKVPGQEMLNLKHCSLLGESPRSGAILSNCDLDGAVVFDGEDWRELDLAAMQKTINQGLGNGSGCIDLFEN
jgi:hypothetical protein